MCDNATLEQHFKFKMQSNGVEAMDQIPNTNYASNLCQQTTKKTLNALNASNAFSK